MKAILGATILRAEGFSKYREFLLLTSLADISKRIGKSHGA
jgi:hypothetical protein